MNEVRKIPPVVHLSYAKGELIIKEGNYGISIYKILKGRVRIFKTSNSTIIHLATLGIGEVFGEMTFFNFLLEPRSASVVAIDDVELEVWHPALLTEEYKNMPAILRYITKQTMNRLLKINSIVDTLSKKKKKEKAKEESGLGKRRYFRKNIDQECIYRPVTHPLKLELRGVVKDINPLGLGVEVMAKNTMNFSHDLGTHLTIKFQLPSGSSINEVVVIRSIKKSRAPGYLLLGVEFKNISKDAIKRIGFSMMS